MLGKLSAVGAPAVLFLLQVGSALKDFTQHLLTTKEVHVIILYLLLKFKLASLPSSS